MKVTMHYSQSFIIQNLVPSRLEQLPLLLSLEYSSSSDQDVLDRSLLPGCIDKTISTELANYSNIAYQINGTVNGMKAIIAHPRPGYEDDYCLALYFRGSDRRKI
jgi:hypothetical protein